VKRAVIRACLMTVVISTTVLVLAGTASGGFSTGNSDACLNGGWQHLQTSNGEFFEGETSCVRYAIHGGTLFFPTVTAFSYCDPTGQLWQMSIFISGFNPNAAVTVTLHEAIFMRTGSNTAQGSTDRDGFRASTSDISPPPGAGLVTVRVRDAQGVEATTQASPNCPP
jgi:hypothetical protein